MRRPMVIAAALCLLAACAGPGGSATDNPTSRSPLSPTPTPTPTPTPDPPLAWGPTQEQFDEAAALVAAMSVEQQAGQVIVARYDETTAPIELVERLHLGGVIVMGHNVESPEQVASVTRELEDANPRPYPLVISVDQEGGRVARIRTPATEFPSLMTLGATRDAELTSRVARSSGDELRSLGFTMVFAPDADVTSGPDDPTIGSRSASSDPALASDIVTAALRGYDEAGILAVAKHFPGHGSVPADSHEELPVQTASLADLSSRDFAPFRAAVAAGVPAMMVAHIDVESIDPGVPSSLSPEVVGVLRDEIGFDGVVITDALDMAAITKGHSSGEAAVSALRAGADVLLMPLDTDAAHSGIVQAVSEGALDADRLAEAATRVVALMLHQAESAAAPSTDVVGSNGTTSYEASLAGITVVSGACEGPLVGEAIHIVGGNETDRHRLATAAREAGLTVGSGDVVRLLGAAPPVPGNGDVVVSLDTPYALGSSSATTARIALYSRTPDAFTALVDVLTGEATAGGTLPVDVPGVDRSGCA